MRRSRRMRRSSRTARCGRACSTGWARCRERDGNVCYRYGIDRGDVDAIVRATRTSWSRATTPSRACTSTRWRRTASSPSGTPDGITMWATCQHPFLVRAEIAALFDVPLGKVRIVVPYLGGGFGSKSYTKMEPITVALARKAGRPVKIVNSVDGVDGHDPPPRGAGPDAHGGGQQRHACSRGRSVIAFDTGAYADNGPRVTATGGDAAPGPYRWSAVRVDALCVHTNTAPSGSYRAFGASHVQWVGELQVDEVARRAGLDAVEIRRRNLLTTRRAGAAGRQAPRRRPRRRRRARSPRRSAGTATSPPTPAAACRSACSRRAPTRCPARSSGWRRTGRRSCSSAPPRWARASEPRSPRSRPRCWACDAERVRCIGTDTRFTPYDRSTGASRSTTLAGLAVQRAAQQVRDDLLDIAAQVWPGREAEHRAARRRRLVRRREADVPGAHREAIRAVRWPAHRRGRGPPRGHRLLRRGTGLLGGVHRRRGGDAWTVETGVVHGDPDRDRRGRGQGHQPPARGAPGRGRHDAGHRQCIVRGDGLQRGHAAQRRPARVPHPVHRGPARPTPACVIVENGDGPGPFGAKGCGEGAFAGIIGALATAVADAGVPMHELPLTPERVWEHRDTGTRRRIPR